MKQSQDSADIVELIEADALVAMAKGLSKSARFMDRKPFRREWRVC